MDGQALSDVDGYVLNRRGMTVPHVLSKGRPVTFRANDYTTLLPDVSVVSYICSVHHATRVHTRYTGGRVRHVAAVPGQCVRPGFSSTSCEDPRVLSQTMRTL